MAKVLEGPGMGLLSKWGMAVPHYVVITSPEQLDPLAQANRWLRASRLVVKAHEAIGSRMKLGLVKVGLDLDAARAAVAEMIGKTVAEMTISQVIVSEMVEHEGNITWRSNRRETAPISSWRVLGGSRWRPTGRR